MSTNQVVGEEARCLSWQGEMLDVTVTSREGSERTRELGGGRRHGGDVEAALYAVTQAAATSRKRGITSRVSIGAGSACIQESSCSLSKGPKRVPHSWGMHSMHQRVQCWDSQPSRCDYGFSDEAVVTRSHHMHLATTVDHQLPVHWTS